MSDSTPPDLAALLQRDYWLIRSVPLDTTTAADLGPVVPAHVAWLLGLEAVGQVLLSGPLLSGPGVEPGAGITVLRADSEVDARATAATDPFVVAGLRTFEVYCWRVNEGSIDVRLSLGTGTYDWR